MRAKPRPEVPPPLSPPDNALFFHCTGIIIEQKPDGLQGATEPDTPAASNFSRWLQENIFRLVAGILMKQEQKRTPHEQIRTFFKACLRYALQGGWSLL